MSLAKNITSRRMMIVSISLLAGLAISLAACTASTGTQASAQTPESALLALPDSEPASRLADSSTSAPAINPESLPASVEPVISEPVIIADSIPLPIDFRITDLVIDPAEVQPGGSIVVTAQLTNLGDVEGSDTVELKINDITQLEKEIVLPAGATEELRFLGYLLPETEPGIYTVSLGELSGQFVLTDSVATLILSSPAPGSDALDQGASGGCGGCGGGSAGQSGCGGGCGGGSSSGGSVGQSGCGGCGG